MRSCLNPIVLGCLVCAGFANGEDAASPPKTGPAHEPGAAAPSVGNGDWLLAQDRGSQVARGRPEAS